MAIPATADTLRAEASLGAGAGAPVAEAPAAPAGASAPVASAEGAAAGAAAAAVVAGAVAEAIATMAKKTRAMMTNCRTAILVSI